MVVVVDQNKKTIDRIGRDTHTHNKYINKQKGNTNTHTHQPQQRIREVVN